MSNSMIMDNWRRYKTVQYDVDLADGVADHFFSSVTSALERAVLFRVDDVADTLSRQVPDILVVESLPPFEATLFEDHQRSIDDGTMHARGCLTFLVNDPDTIWGCSIVATPDIKGIIVSHAFAITDPYPGMQIIRDKFLMHCLTPNQDIESKQWSMTSSLIALETIKLLSCKNVTTEQVFPSRQHRRALQRKGEQPTDERRIIVKVPGKQSHTIAGPRRHGEPEVPAHVVRGHFAEYTPERPLFGKYSGRFWIPAHVRGVGDIEPQPKDYVVKQSV